MAETYHVGEKVPFRLSSGIIIASFFVSLVGSVTTVELLHRRREGKGWLLWLQHLAISVSFGLVAIWCMHFVGNRAITMGNGDPSIQLYYNPGFTALSVFLPIVFLFFGFTTVEFRQPGQRFFWPSLVLAGVIAGLAITGMHYVGNFGISNYKLTNPAGYVVGSAAIACTASVVALSLFFYFKERWINSWIRRLAYACLLAGAVSGMHWTATVGTSYTLSDARGQGSTVSRDTNLIVAIVVSLLACVVCLGFAVLNQRRKRQLADRAQHVVLASATFDPDGKILVTNEGLMPCQKVTRQFNQRSFADEFNTAHPVFQWLFRVTFNWSGVVDLIPAMRNHLRAVMTSKDPTRPITPGTETAWTHDDDETPEEYSIIFREHFCVAANDLADSLGVPLSDLGVLYNGIMMTGSLATDFQPKKTFKLPSRSSEKQTSDIESGIISTMFGRGQLLFLVRTVDKAQVARLMTAGYRFAQPNHVGDIIARSMQVPQNEMLNTIDRLQKYAHQCAEAPLESAASSYLACFAMRAAMNKANGNWEVLVPIDSPFLLPQVELTADPLKPWQQKILTRLDGLSVNQCLSWLNNKAAESPLPGDKEFLELLLDQVTALTISVPEGFFGQAIFSSKPIRVDGLSHPGNGSVYIYAFCIIPDVHSASIKSTNKLTYVPLSFFRCFQRVYKGSPDHAILARKIHREFGAILASKGQASSMSTSSNRDSIADSIANSGVKSKSKFGSKWPFSRGDTPRRGSIFRPDSASDSHLTSPKDMAPQPFGGIMVSSDTTVEINIKADSNVELQDMGIRTEAGVGANEQPTYVDELFKITSTKWRQN
ncbi:uncharacterized protein PV09_03722 [Verruconis gallopava]|uniref:MHYT domain-containing protein n=1 Tax=Verruconis gallopava TaxID=253628 RepID=A0A0D1XR48_9PEZI|nr:uncharacterized protein PV09_03722 [Verruconis gallopava]KIW05171.1 hypothetical protein PV09_03722 [Verruconis gallopava]